ncbi:hypothetical protein [Flavobacterium terrae]|uniref:Lipoprotein n=1 Tax=Flavobacterium terrae TaxID=415425 RepID=A0A1M6FZ04_9FLAO|nr:hypothetical protein [Flavobacterium terrae]SHJ02854.1 hypothetical protein SAMN05444363_2418 [Flavobacterium terrae]
MKVILSLIFVVLFILGCTSNKEVKTENIETFSEPKNIVTYVGKNYFNFDNVELFNIDIDEEKVFDLWSKKERTRDEEIFIEIIGNHDIPKSISDISFLTKIKNLGYKKTTINDSKNEELKNIFRFKKNSIIDSFACPAIYRDILVFKLKEKIVGIAKICFSCRHHYIVGTKLNTEQFGQGGDYEKLYEILYNKQMLN